MRSPGSLLLVAGLLVAAVPGDCSTHKDVGVPAARARLRRLVRSLRRTSPGTWVSVVTEHWHLRMLVPPKGDFAMLPLNPEAPKARRRMGSGEGASVRQ